MSDVVLRALSPLEGALRERGIPADLLTEGLPFQIDDFRRSRSRIPWDVFALVCERAEKLLGSSDDLEALTRKHSIHPRLEFMHRVLSVAATPRDLYWMGTMWFGRMLFSVVEDSFEVLSDGRIRERLYIPPPYRDSPQFFHMMKGVLEAAPTLLGAEHAHVEMELEPRRAIFTVSLPPSQRRRGRLARLFSPRTKRGVVEELIDQQAEFQQTHRALTRISRIGRELAHNIELEKLGDTVLDHLTTIFGCTGVELWIADDSGQEPELLRRTGERDGPCKRRIPLTTAGRELGRLDLWGPQALPEDGQVDSLGELAPWISIALDNARAHSALRRASEQLRDRVRQQDEELVVANDNLEHAERLASVGTLAAGIAHEINNPVGSILLAAEYAKLSGGEHRTGAANDSAVRDTLDGIIGEAKRCAEIVKNVLRFSRNEPTKKTLCELDRTVRRAVSITRDYARSRGVSINTSLGDAPCQVVMNSMEIEQVLANLIRNAIEASDTCATVMVSLATVDGRPEVNVSDEGCGIASEHARQIFDPFYTTRRSAGATGLGLSVAHSIVNSHGGRLRVQSEVGRGTRMTLELPAPDPEDPSQPDAG